MIQNYFFRLILFVCLIEQLAATTSLAKPGCMDTCENVKIPYPFGTSEGCFLNNWYEVVCLDNRLYLSRLRQVGGEVLDILLYPRTLTINANTTKFRVCGAEKDLLLAANLLGSPFSYNVDNKFIFLGCGNVMLFVGSNRYEDEIGCTSACDQSGIINGCYGINCCEITSEFDNISNVYVNFSNLETRSNSCASVIFGNYGSYSAAFSDPTENLDQVSAPVKLNWDFPEMKNRSDCRFDVTGYSCECPPCTEGNPYLPNGCLGRSDEINCLSTSTSKRTLILIVVGGTSSGICFLTIASFLLYKTIIRRRERKLKEICFKRNGGLLLQQQLSVDENIVDKVRHFTANELAKATDYFNQNRVLGHGGQGTVYKAMLADGKIVAVKKSKLVGEDQVEQFINEVVVLSQINHRNVVRLLGCCLETDVPLLVYEFIPNGTLYDLIHDDDDEFLMSWDMRLRIAIEVAGALAYLHSSTSTPIYHRDIKSSNILLDEKYIAKVSDFGTSRHIKIDQTHITTTVIGTFGYLDPQYFQSNQLTEKSDVYSFGVVLVELLTGQKPISSSPSEESCMSLATRFLICIEEDSLRTILDTHVLESASYQQVMEVAKLSQRCLSLDGKRRPSMREAAIELEGIRMSGIPSTVETNFQQQSSTRLGSMAISDYTSFQTIGNDNAASSLDAYPLLSDTF